MKVGYKKCFVPSCNNSTSTNPNKLFTNVPRKRGSRRKWFELVGYDKDPNLTIRCLYCCEDHFDAERDFENIAYLKLVQDRPQVARLRPGVVPTRKVNALPEGKECGLENNSTIQSFEVISSEDDTEESPCKKKRKTENEGHSLEEGSDCRIATESDDDFGPSPQLGDAPSEDSPFDRLEFEDNPLFHSYTGLLSSKQLDWIVKRVEPLDRAAPNRRHLPVRSRIVAALIKLKKNVEFNEIRDLLNIKCSVLRSSFNETVPLLAAAVELALPCPSPEDVKVDLTLKVMRFAKSTTILDCADAPIERSKCKDCLSSIYRIYSRGIGHFNLTVGVASSGLISSVSRNYSVMTPRILEALETKKTGVEDQVMVDNGFYVEKENLKRNMLSNQSSCFNQRQQLSKLQRMAQNTKSKVDHQAIARRLLSFELLKGRIRWHFISQLESLLVIACALINLDSHEIDSVEFLSLIS